MDNTLAVPKSTAKDVFLYLGLVITIVASVIATCSLLWQYINILFPDTLQPYGYSAASDIMRTSVSTLLIVWPVFVLVSWLIERDRSRHAEHSELRVRKWLLSFLLFASGIAMMIDLVSLVNTFLNGELTIRFTLKVLVILVVAAVIFWYYLTDLRRANVSRHARIVVLVCSAVLLAAVIAGFFVIGSPSTQRAMRADEQRVRDLQDLQYRLISYWQQKEALPETLEVLNDPLYGYTVPLDPTGIAYVYTRTGHLTFTLCATFEHASASVYAPYARPMGIGAMDYFEHGTGETCFDRAIDPDLYPPFK